MVLNFLHTSNVVIMHMMYCSGSEQSTCTSTIVLAISSMLHNMWEQSSQKSLRPEDIKVSIHACTCVLSYIHVHVHCADTL